MDRHAVDLLGFLTLGLLTGFGHCVGMCAPFVLFVSRRYGGPSSPRAGFGVASPRARGGSVTPSFGGRGAALAAQGWYTAGRILTYTLLGGAAGGLGAALTKAGGLVGLRRGAAVVAGLVLVAWALIALSDLGWLRDNPVARFFRTLGPASLPAPLRHAVPGHPFATGLFLGLLPCGMVYSAVVASVALGSAVQGAAALALFGLGTAPALLGLSLADEFLARHRPLINRLSQVFILAMGLRILWRVLVH